MDTDRGKYFVLEWTIKNFSCWNSELHDKVITSTKTCTTPAWWFELHPRGLSGQDEHLVVVLHRSNPFAFLGELSFISSDGSILGTQKVDSKNAVSVLELPPGPKFEEVVTQIRKIFHKDRLTVRWRQRNHSDIVENMRTTINAFDIFFTTSSKILDDLSQTYQTLTVLKYPFDEENMCTMYLQYAEDQSDCSKIALKLILPSYHKNVSVLTRISVINNKELMRTEENKHLFRDANSWIFCNSLTRGDVSKEGNSVNLYFKISPSGKYKHCFSLNQNLPEIALMPTSSFNPFDRSISEERSSSSATTNASNKPESSLTVLSNELMCLYQDQEFSDFQLKCGDVSIPVHRAILSARSPIFKTMLSTDMREAASGTLDIVDLEPSTLDLFLTYLYTGAVEDLQGKSALKLYYAADRYRVPSLKRECVFVLCSSVSMSNVCDILSLADKHQDEQLTSAAHEFFLSNFNEVLASEEWKSFMKSEPMLALETVTHFGEKKYVKRSET